MNFSAGSHLERAITHLKNGSVRETISSLNEFNAKVIKMIICAIKLF